MKTLILLNFFSDVWEFYRDMANWFDDWIGGGEILWLIIIIYLSLCILSGIVYAIAYAIDDEIANSSTKEFIEEQIDGCDTTVYIDSNNNDPYNSYIRVYSIIRTYLKALKSDDYLMKRFYNLL